MANVEAADITVPLTEKVDVLLIGNDDNEQDEKAVESFICVYQEKIKKMKKFK